MRYEIVAEAYRDLERASGVWTSSTGLRLCSAAALAAMPELERSGPDLCEQTLGYPFLAR